MSDCFGELPKHHKIITKSSWKSKGMIMDNFDEIYQRYISSTNCEKCNKEYKNRRDRCMDHSHSTGAFRNILCQGCNRVTDIHLSITNSSGYTNINTQIDKRSKYEFWYLRVTSNGKVYQKRFSKNNYSIEDIVAYRDDLKKELGIEE